MSAARGWPSPAKNRTSSLPSPLCSINKGLDSRVAIQDCILSKLNPSNGYTPSRGYPTPARHSLRQEVLF